MTGCAFQGGTNKPELSSSPVSFGGEDRTTSEPTTDAKNETVRSQEEAEVETEEDLVKTESETAEKEVGLIDETNTETVEDETGGSAEAETAVNEETTTIASTETSVATEEAIVEESIVLDEFYPFDYIYKDSKVKKTYVDTDYYFVSLKEKYVITMNRYKHNDQSAVYKVGARREIEVLSDTSWIDGNYTFNYVVDDDGTPYVRGINTNGYKKEYKVYMYKSLVDTLKEELRKKEQGN